MFPGHLLYLVAEGSIKTNGIAGWAGTKQTCKEAEENSGVHLLLEQARPILDIPQPGQLPEAPAQL